MRLGVGYIVFDGVELLEFSAKSVRNSVDHIVVVYQLKSYYGNSIESPLPTLLKLKQEGVIDQIIEAPFVEQSAALCQANNRNIGREALKRVGCTHAMTMDTDECYFAEQLDYVKKVVEEGNYTDSACQMQTYYKTPTHCLVNPDEFYVPLISKLDVRKHGVHQDWPIVADGTRKLQLGTLKVFTRDEIEMHHYSYVRHNIRTKLCNSSSLHVFEKECERICLHWESWKDGDVALLAAPKTTRVEELRVVPNYFNISI